jgi:hypothetical protein
VQGCSHGWRMNQAVDTSDDTKQCPGCGRALPQAEFTSEALGITSECVGCTWERMCRLTAADLAELARVDRLYCEKSHASILERLRRRFAAHPQHQRLLGQAEAGYVEFAAQTRAGRGQRPR